MTTKPRLPLFAVIIQGGQVQEVITSDASWLHASVMVIDYDADDADELTDVPQASGPAEQAFVCAVSIEQASMDLAGAAHWPRRRVGED